MDNFVAGGAGVLLSLAVAYIPQFKEKFDSLTPQLKGAAMLGFGLAWAIASLALSCVGLDSPVTCDAPGVETALREFAAFMIGNLGAYTYHAKHVGQS